MRLTIGYLYGDWMNIYGDNGNIIALKKRCRDRGIEAGVKLITIGKDIEVGGCDLYFFGGGQDQSQSLVANDLAGSGKGEVVKADVEKGVPLLAICGGYQLLGEYYAPFDAPQLAGAGIFPAYTEASNQRMIGNIVVKTEEFGDLVGFENHSGKTYLRDGTPLGKVVKGFGNNGKDGTEGCIYKNAVGCYMHGSLLPKNPELADWLIKKALEIKYGKSFDLKPLDDNLEKKAHNFAVQRFA